MNKNQVNNHIASLTVLLNRLEELHRGLLEIIDAKIERMRASDIDGMRECIEREAALVQSVTEQEGLRRQLTQEIGVQLGLAAHRARAMNVRQLAEHVDPALGKDIIEAADRLRPIAARVADRNRVAGLIAREILGHLRHVFAALTTKDARPGDGYTQKGCRRSAGQRQLLDAVG